MIEQSKPQEGITPRRPTDQEEQVREYTELNRLSDLLDYAKVAYADKKAILALFESALEQAETAARINELSAFNPLPNYDHSKCADPKTCIGYESARSDFDNEKELRLTKLREGTK